tara:strand:+ start:2236 stop:2556 length:321 start_codon:yes stop_codon:yes gene_type:complete
MNLKYFRKFQKETSDRIDVSYSVVHILLYAYHSETFTKKDVRRDIPLGDNTLQQGMKALKDKRLIEMMRGGGNGVSAIYHITGFGKREVKIMYNKIRKTGDAENQY